jgi:hypothetical protein
MSVRYRRGAWTLESTDEMGADTDEDTDFRSEEVSQVALKSYQSLPLLPPIHN